MILGSLENGAASLPPFGAAGELPYISTSPEDAFCVTENPDRTPAEQEALEIFFNWLFEGENFQLIQNARGTVPVITSMTEDQIVLPDAMIPLLLKWAPLRSSSWASTSTAPNSRMLSWRRSRAF